MNLAARAPFALNEVARRSAINAFVRAQWAGVLAGLLAVAAMIFYPGGTPLAHDTVHYRITQNFLSDLGMTVAYNGEPNRVGATLFVLSLGVLLVGFGSAVWWFARIYSTNPTSRNLARAAGIVVLAACLSFVGVAMTPENSAMHLHVQFTLFAFRALPVASVLLLFAARTSGAATSGAATSGAARTSSVATADATTNNVAANHRVVVGWAIATVCVTAYAAFLTFGPSARTPDGLFASVIAQKSITVTIVVALMYLCRTTARALASPR